MIVFLETLGCSRNQVDSELMLTKLAAAGHRITDDPAEASAIIVNTCTFISTASQEAVDVILQMAQFKKTGRCRRLVVTGCLAQRYKDDKDLIKSLPEVDAFLGTAACERIVDAVDGTESAPLVMFPDPGTRGFQDVSLKRRLTTPHLAYIKVSEGCSRHCTYCVIPKLRGRQRSRPLEDIAAEAAMLADAGVKELILTAENTTDYGMDLETGPGFEQVIAAVAKAVSHTDAWIRFLYAHPQTLTAEIIRTVKEFPNVCSYFDVPVQHASTSLLKRMGRPYALEDLIKLFDDIRRIDPQAALRTTLIVGFPGETDAQFEQLHAFIRKIRFDHLGVFTYSDAEDLVSHAMKNHVPDEVAEKRHDRLMAEQAAISESINQSHVGKTYPVLVEENPEPGVFIGRTMFQAPEVDGVTFIYADGLEIGTFVKVSITDAYEYDLAGELT